MSECEAIKRARISGKSDQQIKALMSDLLAGRAPHEKRGGELVAPKKKGRWGAPLPANQLPMWTWYLAPPKTVPRPAPLCAARIA